jgi:hypothetical protein
MAHSHLTARKPLVFQLAAALERYQSDFDALLRSRFDPDRCRTVIRELAEIQSLSAALPQLAADTLDVVARHVELLGWLLRKSASRPGTPGAAEIDTLQTTHRSTVESMHAKCLRLLERER